MTRESAHARLPPGRRTRILCTLGPASLEREVLGRMADAGMDGVRINTAHGSLEQYSLMVEAVRSVADLPIMVDIKGPEIRTRVAGPISVYPGGEVKFSFEPGARTSFSYNFLPEVPVGTKILIADGSLSCTLARSDGKAAGTFVFDNPGMLQDRKGVNIPSVPLKIPSLSKNDREAIAWALEKKADFFALSFARDASDVSALRKLVRGAGIIAKIENHEGVRNADAILEEADGLMVARGDLGVELPSERIPMIQKGLIRKCNQAGKIAITATQMLESMVSSPRPTRAETSDVANAILDGTDVAMLSSESSIGKYPVQAVAELARIARETDAHVAHRIEKAPFRNISSTISSSIDTIVSHMPVDKVVAVTDTGYTACLISRFRLQKPILAVTPSEAVARRLRLTWGVEPIVFSGIDKEDRIGSVARFLVEQGTIGKEELIAFTAGARTKRPHASNAIEVHYIGDLMDFFRNGGDNRGGGSGSAAKKAPPG